MYTVRDMQVSGFHHRYTLKQQHFAISEAISHHFSDCLWHWDKLQGLETVYMQSGKLVPAQI